MRTMEIKADIGTKELFEFTMYSNYKCIRGVVSTLFSVAAGIGAIIYWQQFSNGQRALMILFTLMFTVIVPLEYYIRSVRQVKKKFQKPYIYTFETDGIMIRLEEEEAKCQWQDIMKVVATKNLVVIYLSPVRAFILPKTNIGSQYDTLKSLLKEKTSCYKFKM